MTLLTANNTKTFYDYTAHRLSRSVDNKLCFIQMTDKVNTIAEVDRLSNLDDESFKLMSDLQQTRRHNT